jgi:hypothetical protein
MSNRWKFFLKVYFLVLLVFVAIVPSYAQDVTTMITDFFDQVETVLMTVAGSAAIIGLLGLAILNMGSVFPFVAEWKQENPKAAKNIMTGLFILLFVGSGAVTVFLSGIV